MEAETTRLIPVWAGCGRNRRVVSHALIDADKYDWLSKWVWRRHAAGYAARNERVWVNGKKRTAALLMHRVIAGTSDGFQTDHINGNKLDNRAANLRQATISQNMANVPKKTGASRYKGVTWNKGTRKWQARISDKRKGIRGAPGHECGRSVSLGHFDTEEAAALAYNRAALEVFGEFAWLNELPGA